MLSKFVLQPFFFPLSHSSCSLFLPFLSHEPHCATLICIRSNCMQGTLVINTSDLPTCLPHLLSSLTHQVSVMPSGLSGSSVVIGCNCQPFRWRLFLMQLLSI